MDAGTFLVLTALTAGLAYLALALLIVPKMEVPNVAKAVFLCYLVPKGLLNSLGAMTILSGGGIEVAEETSTLAYISGSLNPTGAWAILALGVWWYYLDGRKRYRRKAHGR